MYKYLISLLILIILALTGCVGSNITNKNNSQIESEFQNATDVIQNISNENMFVFDKETGSIVGFNQNIENPFNVIIPETINSIPVQKVNLGKDFNCKNLISLSVPASVTTLVNVSELCENFESYIINPENTTYSSIDGVLYNADKTELIDCPVGKKGTCIIEKTVTNISGTPFYKCNKLEEIIIPSSLENYADVSLLEHQIANVAYIFNTGGLKNLKALTVDSNSKLLESENGVLFTKGKEKLLVYPCGKADKEYAIPAATTQIAPDAFSYAQKLEKLSMHDNITHIGEGAFKSCISLKKVDIPSKISIVEDETFYYCTSLKSISLPDTITSIGKRAFWACHYLENIEIPSQVTYIGKGAFDSCFSLKQLKVPDTITTLEENVFAYCNGLETLELPNTLTTIKEKALYNCPSIKKLVIPDSVSVIEESAFFAINKENIIIPKTIQYTDELFKK